MDSKQTTAADVWVKAFFLRLPECLKQIKRDGFQGCVHVAADDADLVAAEYTRRFGEQP